MSETAHTPGPWVIKGGQAGLTIWNEHTHGPESELAKTFRPVAEVYVTKPHIQGEHESNAHLIAAAPDMYSACRDCLEGRGDWVPAMAAAIAKAEGKST
jgi:hypothetical protein